MNRLSRACTAVALSVSAIALASPALAKWRVAETDHFIYYSESPEEELLETVKELETFDTLVRALTNNDKPANPVKVKMFEVGTMADVNQTFPYPSRGVGGYYSSNSDGPFLVTFRNTLRTGRNSARKTQKRSIAWGPEVRQHEYLHHYMYQYFYTNYPSWYSEGFAEYYGTMAFPEEGVVEIGHAPFFRMDAISSGSWVDAEELLAAKSYADVDNISALYAQGWLLTHLAAQDAEVGKQLKAYLASVAGGAEYVDAAKSAFGDLDALDDKLKQHKKGISAMRLSLKPIDFGDIPVRELSELESRLMRFQIRLYSGYKYSDLPLIIQRVETLMADEPENIMGLEIKAKLQNMAGQHAEALRSANTLLTVDPGNIDGLTQKGIAMAGALDASSSAAEWDAARQPITQAASSSAIAIAPRVAAFKTFSDQGVMPSVDAQNLLVEAFNLLPQNDEIRYLLARDFEQRGFVEDAIEIIKPSAFGTFDGHDDEKERRGEQRAEAAAEYSMVNAYEDAKDMLNRLEAKRDGNWDESTQTIIANDSATQDTAAILAAN